MYDNEEDIDFKKINSLYKEGKNSFSQMSGILQEATRLTFSNREFFYEQSPDTGEDKERYIFDNTAQMAGNNFVDVIQENLFSDQFFTFEVGENVPQERRSALRDELKRITKEYHNLIKETNYKTALNGALSDVAVSTGFLEIIENRNTYNKKSPISFIDSPMSKTYFTEVDGNIINTWRENNAYFSSLKLRYPFVNWENAPYKDDDLVSILDCCVYQPRSNDDKEPFIYYITDGGGESSDLQKKIYFLERRSYPIRFGFGTSKYSIGTYRQGQILKLLPEIRMVNGIAEMNWIAIQYNSMPIMMVDPSQLENPSMLDIVPGTTIKMNELASNPLGQPRPPAQAIPFNINSQSSQLQLENLQQRIEMGLFATSSPDEKVRSATEVNVLDNSRTKGISRVCNRLKDELCDQFIVYTVKAFRRMGYLVRDNPMEEFDLNSGDINIVYNNIFSKTDDLDTINSINEYRGIMQAFAGPEMTMQTINMADLPETIAEKLNLPVELVKSPVEITAMLKSAKQAQQQQQAQNATQISQADAQKQPSAEQSPQVNPLQGMS